jgi:hypothetical protein
MILYRLGALVSAIAAGKVWVASVCVTNVSGLSRKRKNGVGLNIQRFFVKIVHLCGLADSIEASF